MKDGVRTRVSQKGKKVLCPRAFSLCGLSVAGTLTLVCNLRIVLTQLFPPLAISWNYSTTEQGTEVQCWY